MSSRYEIPTGRGPTGAVRRGEARRFKVITNGLKTEYQYFTVLNRLSLDVIEPETKKGLSLDDMLSLAEQFISRGGGNYDEVCIVLDIDDQMGSKRNRVNLEGFLEEAGAMNVPVYLSNESFEVWLLAHVVTVPKQAENRKVATSLAIQNGLLDNERRKNIVEGVITPESVSRALAEADRLRRTYGDRIMRHKPTTDVDKLVKKVRYNMNAEGGVGEKNEI